MRVLFYSEDIDSQRHVDILAYFENTQLAIIDKLDDIKDAEYCIEIRDYDYIILDLPNKLEKYLNLLKSIKVKDCKNSNTFILNSKYKLIDYDFYLKNKVIMTSSEELMSKLDLKEVLIYNNIKLQITGKNEISFKKDEKNIIKKFKNLEFLIMIYFIRHYGEIIHIDRLIEATVQEPEFEKKTSVESAISSIKKIFNSTINIVPIVNIKKKGYVFQY
ncbi:MAG TPA: helix-turn-helix domain-containing protein [Bacteroidia bacterium]|nr:helix-turn-helix domain-containing protein [Bacteroidia bacterium]